MAIYSLFVFLCCRYGPNSAYTPLGVDRLPLPEFLNVAGFILLMILSELICTVVVYKTRFMGGGGGGFNLRPFLGGELRTALLRDTDHCP